MIRKGHSVHLLSLPLPLSAGELSLQPNFQERGTSLIKKLTDINRCLTDPANRCLTDINRYYISYSTYPALVILNR